MAERMTAADVAALLAESRTVPQHVGGLAVFERPSGGFGYDELVRLVEERIALAPRYRKKVRSIAGRLANPVWVDDVEFDITYHVRRSEVPRPGGDQQLLDFCARIQSRRLDRDRPLWETYLVEGLDGGRIAIVTKTHVALVGEPDGVDLLQVLLDPSSASSRAAEAIWMPEPEPGTIALAGAAVRDTFLRPAALVGALRGASRDVVAVVATAGRFGSVGAGAAGAARAVLHRSTPAALRAEPGERRRFTIARTRLDDYRRVGEAYGATVNDVVLAVISSALRGWFLARAVPLRPATTVRALLPVSTAETDPGETDPGVDGTPESVAPWGQGAPRHGRPIRYPAIYPVRPLLVDLPLGEPDPLLRLAQLRYAMAPHVASGHAVRADRLATIAGFAPPTLLALGARAANQLARRAYGIVITNVPGPQVPLFAGPARMTEMFPIMPLGPGRALTIALTSYDGDVDYGINGDWDSVRDISLISDLIVESLAELLDGIAASAAQPSRTAAAAAAAGVSAHGSGPLRSGSTPEQP